MKWFKIALFVLDGIVVSQLISNTDGGFDILLFFSALPLTLWVVLVIHEIAHALVFLILRFQLKELKIGLLAIQFEGSHMRVRIEDAGFFRGFCAVVPTSKKEKRKAIAALLAGGVSS